MFKVCCGLFFSSMVVVLIVSPMYNIKIVETVLISASNYMVLLFLLIYYLIYCRVQKNSGK